MSSGVIPSGGRTNRDYDPALLFFACALHDVGLTEVDGADVAAEFLAARGLAAKEIDTVWEAIALHTSPGIVPDVAADAIHAAYPRRSMARSVTDEIVAQARRRPEKQAAGASRWGS